MAVKLQLIQMKIKSVFSSCYLPPIVYFKHWLDAEECLIDVNEFFVKQTYRNRCTILGADGKLDLILPIHKRNSKQLMKEVKISYDDNWKKNHWKSIESAYRRSPYFEFYEDEFYTFYHDKEHRLLIDFNMDLMMLILKLLKTTTDFNLSDSYIEQEANIVDYRMEISPKNKSLNEFHHPDYIQVFSDKLNFEKNLSIIDLLFNEGPNALSYIQKLP